MSKLVTSTFWKHTAERAIKTVAQTAVAGLTVTGVTGVLDVAWSVVLSASVLAGIVSVLTSIGTVDNDLNRPVS